VGGDDNHDSLVHDRRRSRVGRRSSHRVRVTRSRSWFSYHNGSTRDELVCVTAFNVGAGPVTVTGRGIEINARENLAVFSPLPGSTVLPRRLESGAKMNLHLPAVNVVEAHHEKQAPYNRMRGWVRLATGEKVYDKTGVLKPATVE